MTTNLNTLIDQAKQSITECERSITASRAHIATHEKLIADHQESITSNMERIEWHHAQIAQHKATLSAQFVQDDAARQLDEEMFGKPGVRKPVFTQRQVMDMLLRKFGSQAGIAEATGISKSHISRLFAGTKSNGDAGRKPVVFGSDAMARIGLEFTASGRADRFHFHKP